MASLLGNEHSCVKHCWGAYEQKALWILVDVDVSTAETAIIASNEKFELFPIICRIQNLVQHIQ